MTLLAPPRGFRPPGPTAEDYQAAARLVLGDQLRVTPYDYQAEAFCKTFERFEEGDRSTAVIFPTGCGKTIFFMMVALKVIQDGGRVLVIAHRGELIEQARGAAETVGLTAVVEKADEHARPDFTRPPKPDDGPRLFFGEDELEELDALPGEDGDPRLVIASVQTLQGARLKAWPPGHFDLIVCDEAHHATAGSYRAVIDHLAPPMYLGVTATGDRADKDPLFGRGQVFESVAHEYLLVEAVHHGYLARPRFRVVPVDVDLSTVRTTGRDFNPLDLERVICPKIEEIARCMAPHVGDRKFLAFTPDVGSADLVASAFSGLGLSCDSVSGACPDRDARLDRHRDGRVRGLSNCQLLTEGYDDKAIAAILMLRPTKSWSLFVQMVGRGLRRLDGKPDCLILFPNWKLLAGKKLVRPVELFDRSPNGRVDPSTLDAAQGKIESGETDDLLLAVKRAHVEKETRERERLAMEVRERTTKETRAQEYDPLNADPDAAGPLPEFRASWEEPATHKQIEALVRGGRKQEWAKSLSKKQAAAVLAADAERRAKGLCTEKQAAALRKNGHPKARSYSFEMARRILDAMFGPREPKAAE